ncbi:MAG: ketol-acid reductoisomerase [Candidatus Freyarchaeum deiterrae]
MTKFYHDEDADLALLKNRLITVIGYGNQGRAQALNMRDSGLNVIIGNIRDSYWKLAEADGFEVYSIKKAAAKGDIIFFLVPDELMPQVYEKEIQSELSEGKVLNFASGYNIAFGLIKPPKNIDVIMLAPRMIGKYVRELFAKGEGFPSFIAVENDASGKAKELVLALAKGIGSTRAGVLEVTMAQEAYMDLFSEQGTGPIIGRTLMTAFQIQVDAGLPPEAVLIELYMSGELGLVFQTFAETGIAGQMGLHSQTSQYGSISRSLTLNIDPIVENLKEVFEKIKNGAFAEEWKKEQEAGYPKFKQLKELSKLNPLAPYEKKVIEGLKRKKFKESV